MSEVAPRPEKQVAHAVNLVDRLYHSRFTEILDPARYEDFYDSIMTQLTSTPIQPGQRFVVQFFISETSEELADSEALHWVAISYKVLQTGEGILLDSEFVVRPRETTHDLEDLHEFSSIPFYALQWSDIAWDQFDPDQPVHPED